jgi:sensor histidine kinase regulating citrate/malate metabolism
MLALMEPTNPVYALFPCASFVLFVCLFNYYVPPDSPSMFALMVFFEAFIVFLYGLLFMHTHAVFDRIQAENRLENTEKQFQLQKKYYEEIDRNVRAQRERLHDMRHHLIAVDSLARTGDCAAISQYVEQLIANYGRQIMKRYCENTVANAVIGGYIDIAEAKGISVTSEIDLPGNIRIDDYELCILFGNTIENAIEACERIPADSPLYGNRFITIKSRAESGRLVMRVENSFVADTAAGDSGFTSSKGPRGGIGLESVQRVVLMHQGCLNCERHDHVFTLSALLCDMVPLPDDQMSKLGHEM